MTDNLNWISFQREYHLKNDTYVKSVNLLQRLQNETHYPIILYPLSLREQISKKFAIGSIGFLAKNKSYIYMHDFLNCAKLLNLKGNDWKYLIHPHEPQKPILTKIPTEKKESYKTRNWKYLIPIMLIPIICTLPAFFSEDPSTGIIIAFFWIPFILLVAYQMGVGKTETKVRIKKLTPKEINQLKQDAQIKYQNDIITYKKLSVEYENNLIEYNQLLNSQAALLDKYSKLIASRIFKCCLISKHQIKNCDTPPQRGASENILFYALMKEFPSYIKVDKILGIYSPDLVLYNGHSCPIDIEIDEPYEYKTKKEIHYIGCGDEKRNNYFISNNWFVLRFTENQIKNHLTKCVEIVKALTYFIEWGDTSKLCEAERTIIQIQEPRWTKEKSRMLAIENYRATQ